MLKNINWTVVYAMVAAFCFAGGLVMKPLFEYSPIFGFFLGFIFQLTSLFFAIKTYRQFIKN